MVKIDDTIRVYHNPVFEWQRGHFAVFCENGFGDVGAGAPGTANHDMVYMIHLMVSNVSANSRLICNPRKLASPFINFSLA